MRHMRKTARKAGLDFFKQKSELVMRVFKLEQMHMVEEYYILKQKDKDKQYRIDRMSRLIQM